MLSVALSGKTVCLEDGLNLVEELPADEAWVASLVLLAAVGDYTGVVRA